MDQRQNAIDTLADGLDVAIFICDARANVLYSNQRASEMFKFENPVVRTVLAVTLSYDLEQLVLEAVKQHKPQSAEIAFSYPEDRTGSVKAWQPEGGRVFVSIYETTDLKYLERVRQDFVSNVSHELRTPLTIIRAMAETLLDEKEPDEPMRQKYLGKVISEVDRLSLISNDLLILSTAESNAPKKSTCDIAEVFHTAVNQLANKAKDKKLDVAYQGPQQFMIEANPMQMTQVALNLIDNAINYTPEGSVTVTLEPVKSTVKVIVKDTGIGIGSEHLPRIFERFYRVDKGRSRATGGTGLGLSIVKHIIESHGGTVTVESNLNQGSSFTVVLPVGDVSD